MQENNKRNNQKILMIVGMVVVAIVIAIVSYTIGFNNGKVSVGESTQQDSQELNNAGKQEELEAGFSIDTPYGAISYPLKWKEQIRTEAVEQGDSYTVQFHGTVEGREEVHLFDIIFAGENGYNIGHLTTDKGTKVAVNIVSYDFKENDEWTDEEYNTYCAMQEDVNYIIQVLLQNEDFEESM